jgi:type I restriction enzyme S subunit
VNVEWVPLRHVLRLDQHPVQVAVDGRYPSAGVLNRGRGLFDKGVLSGADTSYGRLFRLAAGHIVYSKLFGWEGAIALVPWEFDGYFVSSEFPTFAPDLGRVVPGFLEQYIESAEFTEKMTRSTNGLGQRRQRVNVDAFLRIPVPMPPLSDQERIVAHLAALPARLNPSARRGLELTQRDWPGEQLPVAELVEPVSRREQPTADGLYPMQGVRWYGEGLFTREVRTGSELAGAVYRIEFGDLVYSRLFAWKQSFALATSQGWASNEFPTFRVKTDRVRPRVLLAALLSPAFTAQVNAASTGSTPTSRNRLKERDFLGLSVTIPPIEDQPAVEAALELMDRIRPLARHADELASAILPAARNEIFNAMR